MWKRVALLLAISALAACAQTPAPAPVATAPRAQANVPPPVSLAPQPARTVAPAKGLQGQWNVSVPQTPSYTGTALIDAQHRVTFAGSDQGQERQSLGYAKVDFPKVEIVLTDRKVVSRTFCSIVGPDRMECRTVMPDGGFTVPWVMTRVGDGPATLLR